MNTGREQRSLNAAMCRAIWCPLDKDAGISNKFHTVKVAVALMQVVIRTHPQRTNRTGHFDGSDTTAEHIVLKKEKHALKRPLVFRSAGIMENVSHITKRMIANIFLNFARPQGQITGRVACGSGERVKLSYTHP